LSDRPVVPEIRVPSAYTCLTKTESGKQNGYDEYSQSERTVVLCVCGFMHVDPFTKKLEEKGCSVEQVKVTDSPWFQQLYGKFSIVEENGKRWCVIRYS
jgi:hypothetical protein